MTYSVNSIAEAPKDFLATQPGGTTGDGSAFASLQNQFLTDVFNGHSIKDNNSFMGGILAESDDATAAGFQEADDGVAALGGSEKSIPVISASQTLNNSDIISAEGGKQFLTFSNIYDQFNKTPNPYNTPAAQDAFDRLFDAKKDPLA